jgi:hypothetical protein
MLKFMLVVVLASRSSLGAVITPQPKEPQSKTQGKTIKSSTQSGKKTGKESAEETDTRTEVDRVALERRQRSVDLILLAAEDAAKLDDERNTIRIQALAADVLWKYEQARARSLFQNAFAVASNYHQNGKGLEQERIAGGLSLSRPDLRLEVIRLVGKHDTQLSRQFTDQYVEEKRLEQEEKRNQNKQPRSYDAAFGEVDEASNDTLHIAEKLLAVNKKDAVSLAEQAFAKGIPQVAGYLFTQIAQQDRESADKLYLMALDRMQRDKSPVPGQLLLLASYPFGDGNVWVSSGAGISSYHFPVSDKFTIDEKIVQRFIAVAFVVLARNAEANTMQLPDANVRVGAALFAAKLLQPRIAKYCPERLREWGNLTDTLFHAAGDQTRMGIDKTLNQISERAESETPASMDDRIKKLLNRAQNTNNFAHRDDFYQKAALLADQKSDVSHALEIADRISNREHRRKLRSWLNFEAASRAIDARKFDEARQYASEVEATDQSAYLFSRIAQVALAGKDQVKAHDLLAEAARRAIGAENTPEKLHALLVLISIYSRFDSLRGFDLANEAVGTANKLQNYDLDQGRLIRSLETPGGNGIGISVESTEEFEIGKSLASLAKSNFEPALLLARSLNYKPLGLMAIISVAASVFDK